MEIQSQSDNEMEMEAGDENDANRWEMLSQGSADTPVGSSSNLPVEIKNEDSANRKPRRYNSKKNGIGQSKDSTVNPITQQKTQQQQSTPASQCKSSKIKPRAIQNKAKGHVT